MPLSRAVVAQELGGVVGRRDAGLVQDVCTRRLGHGQAVDRADPGALPGGGSRVRLA